MQLKRKWQMLDRAINKWNKWLWYDSKDNKRDDSHVGQEYHNKQIGKIMGKVDWGPIDLRQ